MLSSRKSSSFQTILEQLSAVSVVLRVAVWRILVANELSIFFINTRSYCIHRRTKYAKMTATDAMRNHCQHYRCRLRMWERTGSATTTRTGSFRTSSGFSKRETSKTSSRSTSLKTKAPTWTLIAFPTKVAVSSLPKRSNRSHRFQNTFYTEYTMHTALLNRFSLHLMTKEWVTTVYCHWMESKNHLREIILLRWGKMILHLIHKAQGMPNHSTRSASELPTAIAATCAQIARSPLALLMPATTK